MKTSDFNWGDNIIDSRDIIARYEELNDEYESLVSSVEEEEEKLASFLKDYGLPDEVIYSMESRRELDDLEEALDEAEGNLNEFKSSFEMDELETLKEVISQGESSPDWNHGEQLIHEDYFTQYTEELVDDCYELPKEFKEGKWPWCHINMDWEAAAEELKADYFDITVDGQTYYIRG